MTKHIRWFRQLRKDDTAVAGGKGANLGEMTSAGLPVPPGFVVTAAAFEQFIRANDIGAVIDAELATLDPEDYEALESAAKAIQAKVSAAAVPPAIADEVRTAYATLSRERKCDEEMVAVRSSATMEDTEAASFAGMNRSFVNVKGADSVIERLRDVWASLYSPRVIYYRKRLELPSEAVIAVIVQAMVNSAKSGVAFSADPTTGDDSTMVIEAAFGLGEVVVGGQVEPDHYEVRKSDLEILRARTGTKEFMLTRAADGSNTRVELSAERARERVLSDAEIEAVAELVRRDEAHYGSVQDTEWALEDGQVFLVQSRPARAARKLAAEAPAGAGEAEPLVQGLGASPGSASGRVRVVLLPGKPSRWRPGKSSSRR